MAWVNEGSTLLDVNGLHKQDVFTWTLKAGKIGTSVTRLGNLLDFGQVFKAFNNN